MDIGSRALYSEASSPNGMTTDKADMIFASIPYRIMHEFQIPLYDQIARARCRFLCRDSKRPASCWIGGRQ